MTDAVAHDLVDAVRRELEARADPVRAPRMQRYMKSAMPYYGVRMPEVRLLTRALCATHPLPDRASWEATALALFDEATHREERYTALMLLAHRRYAGFLTGAALPVLEHIIVVGAWWDIVDDASHRVGTVLLADRPAAEPVIRSWVTSRDRWLRRAAIICQLSHRERTDVVLLADAITAALGEGEFFLRKGIGWALREYAKTDREWVRRFVSDHGEGSQAPLSPLSRREALKNLPR